MEKMERRGAIKQLLAITGLTYHVMLKRIDKNPTDQENRPLDRPGKKIGLVHQVADDEELMSTAMELAKKLASDPSIAFALAKQSLNHAWLSILEKQLEVERTALLEVEKTEDYSEAIKAFFEKRKPVFSGK